MLNAIRGVDDPHEQLAKAIAAVQTAIEIQDEGDLYGALLAEYLYKLVERDPAQVFHDDLATWCEPVQFHELIAHAGHHGLAYLTEADFHETIHGNHRPELIDALSGDELAKEQQIDFLRLRMYRQTLLTKRKRQPHARRCSRPRSITCARRRSCARRTAPTSATARRSSSHARARWSRRAIRSSSNCSARSPPRGRRASRSATCSAPTRPPSARRCWPPSPPTSSS